MYNGLLHAHSGLRWIALVLILAAIFNAIASKSKGTYEKKDKLLNLFAMISLHTQLLIGLGLYFMNERLRISYAKGWMTSDDGIHRFFGMEHFIGMLLAIVVITIGRKKAEKSIENSDKHKKIITWYLIGLLIIIAFIPWPFRSALYGAWF